MLLVLILLSLVVHSHSYYVDPECPCGLWLAPLVLVINGPQPKGICQCPDYRIGRKAKMREEIPRRVTEVMRRPNDRAMAVWKPHSPWVNHEFVLCKMYGITEEDCPSRYMCRTCFGEMVKVKQKLDTRTRLENRLFRLVDPNVPIYVVVYPRNTYDFLGVLHKDDRHCPRILEQLVPDQYDEPLFAEYVFQRSIDKIISEWHIEVDRFVKKADAQLEVDAQMYAEFDRFVKEANAQLG